MKQLTKTAAKFLALANVAHGTHRLNLKGFYGKLVDGGYVSETNESPFVYITPKGIAALQEWK